MTPLDGPTIAALIAIGTLLFLAGWRMGSWIAKVNNKIAILDKTIADNAGELARLEQGDDPIEFHADAKGVSPRRDPATKGLPRNERPARRRTGGLGDKAKHGIASPPLLLFTF